MRWSMRVAMLSMVCAPLPVALPARAVVVNSNRAAVITAYEAEFNRSEPASTWAGNQTSCDPGSTTTAYQMSVLQRVNWYRAQAGLPAVTYASQNTAAAQAAALYQSRAKALSHYISDGTPCYSSAASEGSMRSNLALGVAGVAAIDLYIVDPGANNTPVGHRMWIHSTTLGDIATGDVLASGDYMSANALYVAGASVPAVTPRDGFVAWPSPGYFPDAVVPQRWSFNPGGSFDQTAFASAQVTVTGPSGQIPASIVHNYSHLVFEVSVPSAVTTDTTYRVAITGASGGRNWTYDVTLVDVNAAPRSTGSVSYGQSTCAAKGATVARELFTDADGDAFNVRLAAGDGDTDNTKFTVESNGTVKAATELPLDQTTYRIRLRATDARGAWKEMPLIFTLQPGRTTSTPCSVRNLNASHSGQKITVSWDTPAVGNGFLYRAYVNSTAGYCETTSTSCTMTVPRADSYAIRVHAVLGSKWSNAAEVTILGNTSNTPTNTTNPAIGKTPTNTTNPAIGKTLARSKSYTIAKVMKIPAGTRTFKTSGPCRMSSSKKSLVTTSKTGTCKVSVTTSRKARGKTVKTTTRAVFKVV